MPRPMLTPMLRHRARTLAVSALLAVPLSIPLAPLAVSPALAESPTSGLHYKVYIGGFHVVDLQIDLGLGAEAYDVEARLRTIGTIGNMFPWSMKAYSNGGLRAESVVPVAAGQQNNWRGNERFIDMTFAGGMPTVERIKPQPSGDERNAVPPEMRRGAIDLTSAIVAILTRLDAGAPCDASIPVFDGRRRFDLVARPDGTDRLRASRHSPFEGPTVNCLVSVDKKAGFKENDSGGWNDPGREARVWMGRAFEGVPPVPVRLTIDTPVGSLIAHLDRATYKSGDRADVLRHRTVRRAGFN